MYPVDTPFDIPDSWEWVRFKDLVDYSMGKTPPRKETEYWSNGTLPWVSIADLVADGTVTATKECVNSFAAENTFKGKISKAGTLLMSFKLTVGKVSILGIDAFHNEAIISIYPFVDPDKITSMFLFATLPLLSQSGDTKSAIKGTDAVEMLYDSVPLVLSELIRTAFVPKPGCRFYVADFSAIEARVIAWIAGEHWRQEVFAKGGDIYCASASQMFHVPVEKHGVNGHLRQKGKIAELALGYGGSVGALKAMGALNYGLQEEELKPLVDAWRLSNPHITKFWWDVDKAASTCVRERTATETHGIRFYYQSGMMFVALPSGRRLVYVKPKMDLNRFGNESVTYEGVGEQKKWLRLESYGPKFVENIVQATARDILAEAMLRLNAAGYRIVMHVHDEAVIEAPPDTSLENICSVMEQTPTWASGLLLRADGYVCDFYKKD